jgi:hypothetical protein
MFNMTIHLLSPQPGVAAIYRLFWPVEPIFIVVFILSVAVSAIFLAETAFLEEDVVKCHRRNNRLASNRGTCGPSLYSPRISSGNP